MNAQTIMICSGKGGTGKSTVSVLLGAQLGAWSRRVLLIELDSGLRSVDMIAGVYGKTVYDIEDVLCGRCDGSKAIVPSPLYPGLSVISAPYEGGEVRAAPLAGLILAMREYFDYILLDTAAGMGAPFTAANRLADRALVVLTPDPVALRDGRALRLRDVGHKSGQRGDHHHGDARRANLRRVLPHLLVQTRHDDGHVVARERRERAAVEVHERHAGVRRCAGERLAHVRLHVARRAVVEVDAHRQRRATRLVDVGGFVDNRFDVNG